MAQKDGNQLPTANLQQASHEHEKPFHMGHLNHQEQMPTLQLYNVVLAMD